MKLRMDYLNKHRQDRHIFTEASELEVENVWFEIVTILKQWATDIRVYNITKKLWKH